MNAERRGLAILLWATDPDDPARCATPFFHAAAAAAMDLEVELHFASHSVRLLLPGVAEGLRTAEHGGETVAHFMREAHRLGARFLACSSALQAFTEEGAVLIPEVDGHAGAGSFVARAIDPEWATLVF
jgi:predicted peroxiredoxin